MKAPASAGRFFTTEPPGKPFLTLGRAILNQDHSSQQFKSLSSALCALWDLSYLGRGPTWATVEKAPDPNH